MPKFIIKITASTEEFIKNPDISCYLLDSAIENNQFSDLVTQIRTEEKPILVFGKDATKICREQNLDGVLIEVDDQAPYKKQVFAAREVIGDHRILGIQCPLTRHAAMIVSEADPEFIAFQVTDLPTAADLISWYNELFLIQSAVSGEIDSQQLCSLNTDFMILKPADFKILVAKKESLD